MAEMNNPQLQGTVERIEGNAWRKLPNGTMVVLRPGDHINPGDIIVTGHNAHVELSRPNGAPLDIGPDRTVIADQDVLSQSAPDKSEAAILPLDADAERVIAALNAGQDPFAAVEAPGAGLAGGGLDNGHGFVRLLRIVEDVTPFSVGSNSEGGAADVLTPTRGGDDGNVITTAEETTQTPPLTPTPLPPDAVTLSSSASMVGEGGNIVYTVTAGSQVSGSPLVIALSNGLTVTIPVGASSASSAPVSVRPDDAYTQPNDTITVGVTSASGGQYPSYKLPGNVTTTVVDDGDSTTVSLSATPSVAEGGSIVYTATLTNPAATPVVITLANGATINIAAGASSGTVSISAPSDDVYVDAGTVSTSISSVTGGGFERLVVSPTAALTAVSDTTNTITATLTATASVVEGGTITYTVSIPNPVTGSSVSVLLSNGTTVSIPVGASSGTATVTAADNVYIGGGSVAATINTISGGNFENLVASAVPATTTITDDADSTTVSLTATPSVAEGGSIIYTAALTNPAGTAMTVTLSNGAVINIAAGASSGTVSVAAPTDDVYVDAGSVSATIASTTGGNFEALVVSPTAAATIVSDTIDTVTATLTATASVVEGGTITYTVSLPNSVTGSAVSALLSNGATVTIPVGASSGTTTITAADNVYAGGGSTSAAINAISGGNFENLVASSTPATTTITDDADSTTVSLTASPVVAEGGSIVYTASLTNPAGTAMTVTLSNGAVINIAAGASSGTISVAAPSDDVYIDSGSVSATINNATGGNFEVLTISPTAATTTVSDTIDTVTGTLTATASVVEGGTITYTVSLPNPVAGSSVSVLLSNGSTITIPVGASSGTATVTAADNVYAGGGLASATISTISGGNFENLVASSAPATTIITDDSDSTTISLSATPAVAEGGAIIYTATLSNPAGTAMTVTLSNGAIINIAANALVGTVSENAPTEDVYLDAGSVAATITSTTGGNFENLIVSPTAATTTVSDTIDTTTASLTGATNIIEGNSGSYTVSLTSPAGSAPVTITLAYSGVASGVDISGTTTITIPAGANSANFNVSAIADGLAEGAESFTVTLLSATGGIFENLVVSGSAASVTTNIIDNDTPSLAITGPAVVDEAAGTVTYTVTMSNPSTSSVTVAFGTANGTALAGSDYTATSGTLTFAPGVLVQTIMVPITNDTLFEGSETFSLNLSAPVGATIATPSVTSAIVDDGRGLPGGGTSDNDTPSLSIANITVAEGAQAVFTVTLSNASDSPVVFTPSLTAGSAILGTDTAAPAALEFFNGTIWAPVVGNVTIPAGALSIQVRLATTDDVISESNETFSLTATPVSGSTVTPATGQATITDNDGIPQFSIDDVTVNEAAGTITFTVSLSNPAAGTVTVDYATGSGTATVPGDVTAGVNGLTGTLTFSGATLSQTVTLNVTNDTFFENSEAFTVNLSNASAGTAIADASGTGTITDNDPATVFSVANVSISEGGLMTFTVTRTGDAQASQSVNFATSITGANSAEVGDFTANSGTLTFTQGVIQQTFTVQTTADEPTKIFEGAETFTVSLTAPTAGATVSGTNGTALGTILDDGTGPGGADNDIPSLSIANITVAEGAQAVFTVTLSNASDSPVVFTPSLTAGSAILGTDTAAPAALEFFNGTIWAPVVGNVTIPAGALSIQVRLATTDDVISESNETFSLTATPVSGSTVTPATGQATITDNDGIPQFSIDDVTVNEAAGTITFTVSLSNPAAGTVTVDYATGSGTATVPGDVTAGVNGLTGTLTFSGATLSQTVTLNVTNDTFFENSEAFTVNLSNASAGTAIADASGTGTITDNDPATVFSVANVSISEGGLMTFTVTRTGDAQASQSVNFATSITGANSAEVGDFTANSGTLTFTQGVIQQTFTVQTTADEPTKIFEGAETFTVSLTAPTAGATVSGTNGTALGTILDDGTGPGGANNDIPTLAVSSVGVTEGTDAFAVFTVSLNNASDQAVSFNLALASGTATVGTDTGANAALEVSTNGGTTWTSASAATIAAGQTSVLVRTALVNDVLDEPLEAFTLSATVTAGTVTNVGAVSGTGTITDNDPATVFSVANVSISEGGLMTFTVTRTGDAQASQSVNFATSITGANSAEVGDFTANSGTLTFTQGVIQQTFTVQTTADEPTKIFEGAETFTVSLTAPTAGATVSGTNGTALGTILDDGTGPGGANNDIPTLAVSSVGVTEGTDAFAVFTVSLNNASDQAVSFNLALASGTATVGTDTGANAALEVSTNGGTTWTSASAATIAAGQTSVLVRTALVNDVLDEPLEAFTLSATVTAGTVTNVGAVSGTGTITDNDPATVFSVANVSISEGGLMTFTVTRTGDAQASQSVNFATSITGANSAEVGDFTANSGTLTFTQGVIQQTFTVQTTADEPTKIFEGAETFTVSLTAPTAGATVSGTNGTALGTILDDGTGPGGANNDIPTLAVSSVGVTEGTDAFAVFTVSLNNASDQAVSFNLALASGTATVGTDTGANAALEVSTNGGTTWTSASAATIAAGQTSVLVRTALVNDVLDEPLEAFTLSATVTAGTVTNVGAVSGTGTITDNDPATVFSVANVSISEGGLMTFTVTRTGDAQASQSVNFATSITGANSAEVGDFTANSGTLTFTQGVIQQTFTVQTTADEPTKIFEGAETFTVSLTAPTAGATVSGTNGTALGTILDDGTGPGGADNDIPSLSIANITVAEGAQAVFTVTLSNASDSPVVFTPSLTAGSAILGTDTAAPAALEFFNGTIWAPVVGNVTIPAGALSIQVRLATTDDVISESNETFSLTATPVSGSTVTPATGQATITDNDGIPQFSIDDVTVNEAAGTITFTVSLSNPAAGTVTVDYATGSGTATVPGDVTAGVNGLTGTLTFSGATLSQTVTLNVTNDTFFENSEAFTVNLSNASAGTAIADASGTGTITDNDPATVFSVANVSISEGGLMTFTVTRTGDAQASQSVNFATSITGANSAEVGDFTANSGTLTFTQGVIQQTFTVQTTADEPTKIFEGAETFTVSLTAPTAGATVSGTNGTALGTILDDGTGPGGADNDIPSLSIANITVAEGAQAVFTVTLSNASDSPVVFTPSLTAGSAILGTDTAAPAALEFFNGTIWAPVVGNVTIPAGALSIQVRLATTDDVISESNETFSLTATPVSGSTVTPATGQATITDNDGIPQFSIDDVTVNEAAGTITFTVSLSNPAAGTVTVDYATGSGTATVPGDVTAGVNGLTGTLTFSGATLSQTVTLNVTNDTFFENSEAFTVNLSNASAGTAIADASGTGTITDNDPATVFSVANVSISEGGLMTFTVTRTGDAQASQSVNFATSITGANSAEVGDFTANSGTLTFTQGVIQQTFTVQTTADEPTKIFEGAETFTVSLTAPTAGATVSGTNGTALGTILDDGTGPGGADNDIPSLSIANITVAEGAQAVFTVTLSNASDSPVVFTPSLTAGSAILGTDTAAPAALEFFNGTIWAPVVGNVTIPAGALSIQVRLATTDDVISESNETFSLTATPVSGSTVTPATGQATITDNDGIPQFSIDDVTVNEAAGTITFTVSLSNPAAGTVTVDYATGSGTATVPGDVTAGVNGLTGTLTFSGATLSQTVTLNVTNDTFFENSEAFTVNLSNASAGTAIADASGTGTITDNDPATVFSVANVSISEGGLMTFTVTRTGDAQASQSVNFATSITGANSAEVGDFTANSGTLTFTQGVIQQTFTVQTTADEPTKIFEGAETFTVSLTAPTAGATVSGTNGTALGTILDDGTGPGGADNDIPSLSIANITVAEGAQAVFTVTLSNASDSPVVFTPSLTAGSAILGTDTAAPAALEFFNGTIWAPVVGNVTIPAGALSIQVRLATTDDVISESNETFSLTATPVSGSTVTPATGQATITDNDGIPQFSIDDVTVNEAAGTITFTVSLSNPAAGTVTVDYATGSGTATVPGDVTAGVNGLTGTLTFSGATLSQTVTLNVTNDTFFENSEAFTVNLSNASAGTAIADASGTGTITDNDPATVFSVANVSISEGGLMTFTVTRTGDAQASQSVNFATSITGANSAEVGDFTANSGTLTFTQGVIQQTFTVQTTADEPTKIFEGAETFTVSLTAPTAGATVSGTNGTALGTILDDGTGPGGANNDIPTLAVSSVGVTEGTDAFAVFTVSLNNASDQAVSFNLALASGTATVGTDTGANAALEVSTNGGTTWTSASAATIAAGQTSVLVRTALVNDVLDEPLEAFTLSATVTAGTVTNVGAVSGTGTITDNDPATVFSVANVSISEGGLMTFTVTRTGDAQASQSVNFATSITGANSAEVGDFTANSGTLTFTQGVIQQTFTVQTTADEPTKIFEGAETFTVSLTAPTAGATVSGTNGTALGTILDDGTGPGGANNDIPTLAVSSVGVTEGTDAFAVFTVSLNNASDQAVSFNLALASGTATVGTDTGANAALEVSTNGGTTWTSASAATIAAGQTSVLVRTALVNDVLDEPLEAFTLSATVTAGTVTNVGAVSGTGTITDNDPATVFSVANVSISEGGLMTFTVTRTGDAQASQSVNFATSITGANSAEVGDFTANSGTLTFTQGVIQQTFTVQTTADEPTKIFEGAETFTVSLTAPTAGATVSGTNGTALGTILDDGTGPGGANNDIPTLAVSSVGVTEGTDAFAVFTVSLNNASDQAVSFNLALASGTATVGTDTGANAALEVSTNGGTTWTSASAATIAAGQTSVLVRTALVNDVLDEPLEAFTLSATVTAGTVTNVGAVSGTGTITDNDPATVFSVANVSISEGGLMTFTVTRTGDAQASQSVNFATSITGANSAEVGDFTANSGTLTFTQGVIQQTFTVQTTADEPTKIFEGAETFTVSLTAPTAGATVSGTNGTALGTILDDGTGPGGANNDIPTLAVSSVGVTEGTDAFAVFTVSLNNASDQAVSFNLALASGTATVGTDTGANAALEVSTNGGTTWTSASAATIAAGQTSVLVRTALVNDVLDEPLEAFTLSATVTAGTVTNVGAVSGTGTITDNDPATVFSVANVSISEGGLMTFTVTRTGDAQASQSVNFATSITGANSAEVGDFTANSGTLTFTQGVIQQTFTVQTTADEPTKIFEGAETFTVSLTAPTAGATVSGTNGTALGTILDDGTGPGGANNDIPTLAVSSVGVTEGTDAFAVFTVSLNNASDQAVSFNLALASGTATVGTDTGANAALEVSTNGGTTWTSASAATIAAGQTSVLVRTALVNDVLDEPLEAFTLSATVTAGTVTNVGAVSGTGTITDNDPATVFSVANVSISEGGLMTFTVTRTGDAQASQSVNFATSITGANSAEVGDFTANSGTLTFTQGVIQQTFTVQTTADEPTKIFEGAETFTVSLTAPTAGATVSGTNGTALGTILDDGTGPGGANNDIPTLAVSSVGVTEGTDAFAVFTVSLNNASDQAVSFNLALASGTATVGTDTGANAALEVSTNGGTTWTSASAATIAAGQTSVLVRTALVNDVLDEPLEAFTLSATVTAGTVTNVGAVSGTGTITDNDPATVFSVANVSISEGGLMTFTVTRTGDAQASQSVNFATSITGANSAEVGDFTANSGTLTFTQGVIQQTFTVQTTADEPTKIFEGAETFTVSLTAPTAGATVSGTNGTALGTILDDGTGPGGANNDIPTLAVSSVGVTEGTDAFAVFTVSLNNASDQAVSFNLALASGTATVGTDTGANAALEVSTNGGTTWTSASAATIAAGQTSVLVRTALVNDVLDEPLEAFTLSATVTAGTVTNVGAVSGTGTITDNDPATVFSVANVSISEGGLMTFTVTRTGDAQASQSVNFATSITGANSAEVGDFTANSGTLTFTQGVIQQTFTVQTTADEPTKIFEGAETFTVSLTAPTAGATVSGTNGTALGTILDDGTGPGGANNDIPTLAVSSVGVTEGTDAFAVFTVSLNNASDQAVSFNLALASGTATVGTDTGANAALEVSTNGGTTWTSASAATIAAGQTSVLVRTALVNDVLDEPLEAFTLSATVTAGTVTNVGAVSGTGTITDNDPATVFSVANVSISEGGLMTFTVTRTGDAQASQSVNFATSITGANSAEVGDFTANSGTLTFTQGVIQQTFTVQTTADEPTKIFEGAETFTVSLTAPTAGATVSGTNGTALGTILDDGTGPGGANNDIPTLAVSSVGVTEGTDAFAVFTVSLNNASDQAVSFNLALASGTATVGTDTGANAALEVSTNGGTTWTTASAATIAAGQTSVLVRTAVVNDVLDENAETFTLSATVTAGTVTNVGAVSGTGTITDNDPAPTIQSVSSPSANEGSNLVYTVTLSNPSSVATSFAYALGGGTATLGTDYTATPTFSNGVTLVGATLNIPANVTTFTVSIPTVLNALDEPNETVPLTIGAASGTGTIIDADNGSPAAVNDTYATVLGTPITLTTAQLTSNDTLVDLAAITATGGVTGGALVNNGNGTWTFTPSAAGTGTFTYTLTDSQGQTSTATVNITTFATRDDLITVNESALANGTGGGVSLVTGNLLTNDPGATTITNVGGVTDGGAGDLDGRVGFIGVQHVVGGVNAGVLTVDVAGAGLGDYSYQLNDNVDHSAPANNNSRTAAIAYTTNTGAANAQITIMDDRPQAFARVIEVSENALPSYNLVLVLDTSGSMTLQNAGGEVRQVNADGTVTITTRLDMAKAALITLVSEYYNQAQSVSVKLLTFDNTAVAYNGGAAYTDKATLIAAINSIPPNPTGGTDYTDGLTAARAAFGTVNPAVTNIAYFLSDGVPTQQDTVDPAGSTGYRTFVNANGILSYGVGIGSGISNTGPLNGVHNVDADSNGAVDPAIIVPDLNELSNTLISTVPLAAGGNVVNGGGVGNALGADDGYVQTMSLQLDTNANGTPDTNVTFTYNPATNQISWTGGFPAGSPFTGDTLTLNAGRGFTLGALTFNFATGEYTYFTGGVANQGDSFTLNFVARDNDGDVTPPTALTFNVVDGHPVARPDVDTLFANETNFTGNVISGLSTDGGLSLGTLTTDFSAQGSGTDTAVDNASVSAIVFQGQSFNLTTNVGATAALGGTYTVNNGQLVWTHASNGSSLRFNSDGFYTYQPTAANTPGTPSGALTTVNLLGANAAGASLTVGALTFTGIARNSTVESSGVQRTNADGIGVTGGGSNTQINNLETLVVTFDRVANPYGVENIHINVDDSNSNLGGSVALTYSIFHIDGHLLGQIYSSAETDLVAPFAQYSNIGSIEITANSDASASIEAISYSTITNSAAAAIAPVQIGYTLTDTDGDTSSSTLTLRAITNSLDGDDANNTLTGNAANDYINGGAGNDTLDGGAGNDLLVGGVGNDSVTGGTGDDVLRGGLGNDTLTANDGNDVLVGGGGNDLMTGGNGTDVFVWSLGDRGAPGTPAVDTIQIFDNATAGAGGDVLDLRDLLQGESHTGLTAGNLGNYLHFEVSGPNTNVQISSGGGFLSGYNVALVDQTIVLQGVDLTNAGALATDTAIIQDLLTKGKLQSD